MASRNGDSVVERAKVAAEAARRVAAEAQRAIESAREKREAAESARREAEARRVAEARKRMASDVSKNQLSKRPRTNSGPPANVISVLVGNGNGVAEEKSHGPILAPKAPNLLSFFSKQQECLSGLSSAWSSLVTKLLQKQDPQTDSLEIKAPNRQQQATPKAPPRVTVDKELIYAFINYSNPQDYTEYDQYFRACDFLRSSPQNFEAFKRDLKKDLENINSIREEGQVKVKAGDILKRAEVVRGLKINSGGIDEYEKSKRLKYLSLQNELRIQQEKQQEEARKKAEKKKAPPIQKLRPPPIQLPRNQKVLSAKEIENMTKSEIYAQLQVITRTAFSEKGHPGEDRINWKEMLTGNGPLVKRVYSEESPPHNMNKKGIGFNLDPADTETSRKERRIENTNLGYLQLLQKQFDKDANNFDISASVDPSESGGYIGRRVAKWERESRQFKIETTTTNPSNLEEYCEYLMNNIEDLKHKESEKSGEEIDKSKLKTLIAFQYLELGKIIYAGTWGNTLGGLNRSDDSSTQKPEIIKKILVTVPEEYQKYLKYEKQGLNIIHNAISLPHRNPLNSTKDRKNYRGYLENLANSNRIKSTFVPRTSGGSNDWDVKHGKMLEREEKHQDVTNLFSGAISRFLSIGNFDNVHKRRFMDDTDNENPNMFHLEYSLSTLLEKRASPATMNVEIRKAGDGGGGGRRGGAGGGRGR